MGRIIFIKLGAIGDVVMAMTAVKRLEQLHPEMDLTWICSKQVRNLISRFLPNVGLRAVNETRLLKNGPVSSVFEVLLTRYRLGLNRADLLSVGYHDKRYGLLAVGAADRTAWFAPRSGSYHADEYYTLIAGGEKVHRDMPLHPKDLIPETCTPGTDGVVLSPGGAKNLLRDDALRRYPIEHYVTLARMALDRGKEVTLMVAPSDEWIRPHFDGLPVRFELGTLPLEEIPLWLRQFERLITHDSGPMHLGFMSGIPVTALFGPTRADEKVPRNYAANGSIVIQGGRELSCAPCYDGRNYADCDHQSCLKEVIPSPVFFG